MNHLRRIYLVLTKLYGPQGWWPLLNTGSLQGYHLGDYSYPKNQVQRFEICVGAILAQNTSWVNVEKALRNLYLQKLLRPAVLCAADNGLIAQSIHPTGYFNQKTRKLKEFSRFYSSLCGQIPSRESLLNIWGIGPETADSILLYAYKIPTFVVDAYTRRIFSQLGMIGATESYDSIKHFFESSLEPSTEIYQEYHALIVEHAKRYYEKKHTRNACPLKRFFTVSPIGDAV